MRIGEVMTRNVETVEPSATADEAWQRMRERRIRHLVVMRKGAVLGVVSERDLGGRSGVTVRRGRSVQDLMSAAAVTAEPDATVREAANLMRGRSVGCLPVIEKNRLVGILTVSDVLELVGRGVERTVERSKRYTLRQRAPRQRGARMPGGRR